MFLQVAMKFASKGAQLKSKAKSKWKNITNTDLGHVDMEEFKKRMYGHDGHIPTPIARRMMQNGIVQAAGFPPAKECVELIVECVLHYKAQSRQIIFQNCPSKRHLVYQSTVKPPTRLKDKPRKSMIVGFNFVL